MSFIYQGRNRIYLGSQAYLVEEAREMASDWAAKHILLNPLHAFILGRFVEADHANKNQHYFPLQDLVGNETVIHAPMNINHQANNIIGAFVANEIIYPTGEQADDQVNPFMETLSVVWKYYFPEAYKAIQEASANGALFHSMECVPDAVSSVGGSDDSKEYAYAGRQSPSYPPELNDRSVPMKLHRPHFTGGAIVLPPANPAWRGADARQVAQFLDDQWQQAEFGYEAVKAEAGHLNPSEWESVMIELLTLHSEQELARNFSKDQRSSMAKSGQAMSDGSFPIANVADLKNAIRAVGRAKNPDMAKAHIKSRAKALGQSALIPSDWS